jgi:hypothetical protein
MMGAVSAATSGQSRFVAGLKDSLKGAEGKEQHQQDCEGTPHLP